MIVPTRPHAARPAAAALEFAVVLAILLPLLVGVWEVGRLVNAYQVVLNASREAGRRAATGEKTTAEIKQIVHTYLKNAGLHKIEAIAEDDADLLTGGKALVEVKVYDEDDEIVANADPKIDAKQNYKVEVTVILLYKDIEYGPTRFFLAGDYRVTATVMWNSMKDIPLTVNDTIPLY